MKPLPLTALQKEIDFPEAISFTVNSSVSERFVTDGLLDLIYWANPLIKCWSVMCSEFVLNS